MPWLCSPAHRQRSSKVDHTHLQWTALFTWLCPPSRFAQLPAQKTKQERLLAPPMRAWGLGYGDQSPLHVIRDQVGSPQSSHTKRQHLGRLLLLKRLPPLHTCPVWQLALSCSPDTPRDCTPAPGGCLSPVRSLAGCRLAESLMTRVQIKGYRCLCARPTRGRQWPGFSWIFLRCIFYAGPLNPHFSPDPDFGDLQGTINNAWVVVTNKALRGHDYPCTSGYSQRSAVPPQP